MTKGPRNRWRLVFSYSDLTHHEGHDLLQLEGGGSVALDFEVAAHVGVEDGEFPFEQRREAPSRKGNAGVRNAAGKTPFADRT